MPLNEFICEDCGQRIERLHKVGKLPGTCGLDCRRIGVGSFGKGQLRPVMAAPKVVTTRKSPPGKLPSFGEVHREAMRQKGLRKLGGELTERDLDKLRDKGLTVYRKDGREGWARDGGDDAAPASIQDPGDA
jgi:hypothetical protein